jgi:transposase
MSQEPPYPPGLEWLFGRATGEAKLTERLAAIGKAQLIAIILQLLGWIAALRGHDKNLRARLAQSSRNSSRPPSSDGPDKPAPKSQRKRTGRKPGGQAGHEGVTLEMKKVAGHYEYCKLDLSEKCCDESLALADILDDVRRQLWELPPPPPLQVTEWRAQSRRCRKCGKVHTAKFPAHIAQQVQYGARVQAITAYLSQEQLLPYKRTQDMLRDLFGVDISQGTIKNILFRAHKALFDFELRMIALLIAMGLVHFDETGIYVKGKGNKYWLHVACTETHTLYHADKRRGTLGMKRMGVLPRFKGTAVHDHWESYFTFDCTHVLCNEHHLRELTYAYEQYQQSWAQKLIACLVQAKDEINAAKQGGKSALPPGRLTYFSELYDSTLEKGKKEVLLLPVPKPPKNPRKSGKPAQHKIMNLYDRLVESKVSTLAFMYDFSIPFTNNQAERDVRMIKVKLKISGCFRSILGAQMFARTRSFISTARKQGIGVLDALTDLFSGKARPLIRRMTRLRT